MTASIDHRLLPVSEVFYSFQGEGVNLGRRAIFVRFMGCNLTCGYPRLPRDADTAPVGVMICDTEYTWNSARFDLGAAEQMTVEQLWQRVAQLDPATTNSNLVPVDLIVVSGGEPMMRQDAVTSLARLAKSTGRRLEVETNATIVPRPDLLATGVAFNAGLKLANSAVPASRRIKPAAIRALQESGRARWKFVVSGPAELQEIAALQAEFGLTEVWLSPEGTTPEAVLAGMKAVAAEALERGWHLTTRQHVLIWGDERGR